MDKLIGLLPLVTLLILAIVLIRFNRRKPNRRTMRGNGDVPSTGAARSGPEHGAEKGPD